MSVTETPIAPPAPPPNLDVGLSETEVQRRRAAGQGNTVLTRTSRPYKQIVRENVFNFINNVLFTMGAILIIIGQFLDALMTVGVIALNTVVNLVQEIRAKILLDRIAILTRPKATVVRDGREREVDPSEIVLGDLLVLHAGDQVVVDGSMVGGGHIEMDESLLTGESDLVPKHPGDELLSGSFCVTGGGRYVATRVGEECYVSRLTAGAQAFRRVLTPLQSRVNIIIRSLLLVALSFEILVVIRAFVDQIAFTETVRMSTVIVQLIPNGLILSIALAYALGAVRMAGKGALVQQGNAIESMSNVDVLCTDKTGTLTTNTIRYHDIESFGMERYEVERLLGDYAASTAEGNRTTEALGDALPGLQRTVADEAVFSSARKWSGLTFDGDGLRGTYILGAPEMLAGALPPGTDLGPRLGEWTNEGLRVLLFAYAPEPRRLNAGNGDGPGGAPSQDGGDGAPPKAAHEPQLPIGLRPIALVSLVDELRPQVEETLHDLDGAGVSLKIISGDNPQTVAALARQAGFRGDLRVMSGTDIAGLGERELHLAVEEANVFGRVTPQQKEELVGALRDNGHYVAMIGDGVNDVISLKRANVGIAMQGGSQAARAVSDLILLKDSFGAVPWAFREGQRIWNGMQDILRIFMVRIMFVALILAMISFIGGFPFLPRQTALLSFFSAGIPAIALATFARPGRTDRDKVLYELLRFFAPATAYMALLAVGLFAGYVLLTDLPAAEFAPGAAAGAAGDAIYKGQTVITTFATYCSLLLLPMVVPPVKFFVGGSTLRGEWKMTVLAALLMVGFMAISLTQIGRTSFDLAQLGPVDYLLAGGASLVWMFVTLWTWRHNILERFLGLPAEPPGGAPGVESRKDARAERRAAKARARTGRGALDARTGGAAPNGSGAAHGGAAQPAEDRRPAAGPQAAPDARPAPSPPPAGAPTERDGSGRPDTAVTPGQTGGDVSPPGASSSETTGVWTPDD